MSSRRLPAWAALLAAASLLAACGSDSEPRVVTIDGSEVGTLAEDVSLGEVTEPEGEVVLEGDGVYTVSVDIDYGEYNTWATSDGGGEIWYCGADSPECDAPDTITQLVAGGHGTMTLDAETAYLKLVDVTVTRP